MLKYFLLAAICVSLISCSDTSDEILGTWKLVKLKVVLNTIDLGQTGDSTIVVDSTNMFDRMRISSSTGTYLADSTYVEKYYRDTNLLISPTGKWYIKDDTLVQTQLVPEESTSKFKIVIKGKTAKLIKMTDWDQSGAPNDYFEADLVKLD